MRQAGEICGIGHDANCLMDVCWIHTTEALRERIHWQGWEDRGMALPLSIPFRQVVYRELIFLSFVWKKLPLLRED